MKSEAIFTGRMNQDLDPRYLKPNQYRYAKNARVGTSQEQNVGALESEASTSSFTGSYSFPSGTNKCIGACADVKNNSIIYCWYNSNGSHRIFRWNPNTNVVTDILPTAWIVSVLGWTSTTRLWNMRIVESGSDQIMFFHAVQGIPMRINLAISTQRPGSYTLTYDDITVARKPPLTAPTFAFGGIDNNINFVNDNNFQFRYRYIYENGEKTTFGPWSDLTVPDGNNYSYIDVYFNSGVKGVTKVELSVRIGNGVSQTGNVNVTEYIWKVWTKGSNNDSTDYSERFYYTETFTPVGLIDSSKLFDAVPQLVGDQEVVQSNQIIYGDITEGYDNPDVTAIFEAVYLTTGIIKFTNSANTYDLAKYMDILPTKAVLHMIIYDNVSKYIHYYYELDSDDLLTYPDNMGSRLVTILGNVGAVYSYNSGTKILSKTSGETLSALTLLPTNQVELTKSLRYSATASVVTTSTYSTPYADVGYKARIVVSVKMSSSAATLAVNIYKNAVLYATQNISVTTSYQEFDVSFLIRAVAGDELNFTITGGSLLNAIMVESVQTFYYGGIADFAKSGFKLGSKADFGVVYYDEYMRQCGVVAKGNVNFEYDLDNPNTWQFENDDPTKGFIGQAKITISSRPPSWAKYYQIVTSGTKVQNFEQFVGNVALASDTTEITFDSLGSYDIALGDILRIVAVSAIDVTNGQNSQYLYYDPTISPLNSSQFDKPVVMFHEVQSFDLTTNTIVTDSGLYNDATQFGAVLTNYRLIIEIMKPKPSVSEYFFEFGVLYEVGNPGTATRYHKANIQNQDSNNPSTTPAIIETLSGPIWYRYSNRTNVVLGVNNFQIDKFYYILSNSSTDERESNYWNKGRPQIETPDQKQQRIKWMYRWSNQLLQNSLINGMSSFDAGNYGLLSARFGALVAMREIGYTLKMIQEMNYNTAFIGRKQLQNADGSTQLVVTDTLIGIVNPSEDMYGTKHPGSVVSNGRSVYWLDTIKGCVLRESGNQPFEISNYGMQKVWRDASVAINTLGYEVLAGFDNQTEQYFITYKNSTSSQWTWSFFDPEQGSDEPGWIAAHDFQKTISSVITPVDMYGWVGQIFSSCVGSNGYKHNVGSSYLQIYGEQKTMEVESAFILDPNKVTAFLAHWVRANRLPYQTIFTIPVGAQTPYGMRSYLVQGNYSTKENVFYSEIKRDGYTKGFYVDNSNAFKVQMLEGRVMRGHVCLANVQATGSTIFVLFSHALADEYSPLS